VTLSNFAHDLVRKVCNFSGSCASAIPILCLTAAAAMTAFPAAADFRICNVTKSRVGVALGYKDAEGWATEGWWNLKPGDCETLLRGTLAARYYYLYAVDYDRGGEWSGQATMCTRDKEFTIRGANDCLARGFDRTGFFEVDTGEQQTWTVRLTDGGESQGSAAASPPPGAPPAFPAPPATRPAPLQGPLGTPVR
jgi:uncharacterized membrane protein